MVYGVGFTSSPTTKNFTIFATQSILQKSSVWPWLWEICSTAQTDRNQHFLRSWLRILLFYLNLGVTKLLKNQKTKSKFILGFYLHLSKKTKISGESGSETRQVTSPMRRWIDLLGTSSAVIFCVCRCVCIWYMYTVYMYYIYNVYI